MNISGTIDRESSWRRVGSRIITYDRWICTNASVMKRHRQVHTYLAETAVRHSYRVRVGLGKLPLCRWISSRAIDQYCWARAGKDR